MTGYDEDKLKKVLVRLVRATEDLRDVQRDVEAGKAERPDVVAYDMDMRRSYDGVFDAVKEMFLKGEVTA